MGVSTGIKGFRYSVGPRGAYVQIGAKGVYYRKKVSGSRRTQNQTAAIAAPTGHLPIEFEPSVSVDELVESSSHDLVQEINARSRLPGIGPWAVVLTIVFAFVAATAKLPGVVVFIFFAGLIGTAFASSVDRQTRTSELIYDLHDDATSRFATINDACAKLASAKHLWMVYLRVSIENQKSYAGIHSEVGRHIVRMKTVRQLPHLTLNMDVWSIDAGGLLLVFLPDQLLICQNGNYGAVSYANLNVTACPRPFVEGQVSVPSDSAAVGKTWRYVNKNGGPDGRYASNFEFPIVSYGNLHIRSETGLDLEFYVSNVAVCDQFVAGLEVVKFDEDHRKVNAPASGE